jgi:Zn finger protein HypA/HybF involved in hydrogenase expression
MLYKKLRNFHEKLSRNLVWCRKCGRSEKTDSAHNLRYGWPKCCGETMTVDSPDERKAK